ncbi:N-acyl-D-amino-acid deacylase [Jiangella alba]|uniref:N-acyl-D-amino-acid deacylase n=1 Tax=Jiangella alba TaxID=561176 RepID=A0A1H5Q051_9ACTN|nr:N-acyl-D-amino-acid deacylase [Jiangella alba]
MGSHLLVGGTVVDGSGGEPFRADVLIEAGRIAAVGAGLPVRDGTERLDVSGRAVAPGFIDMHAHSDIQIRASDHGSRLLQGITTEVLGQDGLSVAPIDDTTREHLRMQLSGWNGSPEIAWNWSSVAEYLAWLRQGIPVNAAFLVPHANLRLLAMGNRPGPPEPDELELMRSLLAAALDDGAIGLSAGLTYSPGSFADTAELIALCEVVAAAGGYFCPHHRNYGSHALAGYAECVEIAAASGVRLHLAHAHLSFPENRGRIDELVALFDDAADAGVELTFDSYPYLAGMTSLHALLPGRVLTGSMAQQLAALQDPRVRADLAVALDEEGTDGSQGLPVDWTTVRIASADGLAPEIIGRSVAEIAAEAGVAPSAQYLDIVVATRFSATCTLHFGIEEHVRRLMADPRHTVGTDGILVGAGSHPRGWGTFPRVLGEYVRGGVLPLAEAIRHMTGASASILRLPDRGVVAAGACADVVVFDPATISDTATYAQPRQAPIGVDHVFVNGVPAVRDGRLTGAMSGRVLTSRAAARSGARS